LPPGPPRTRHASTVYREGALGGLSVRLFDQHLVDRTWRKVSKVTGKNPFEKMSKGLEVGRRRKWPWCSSSVCFSRTGRVYTTYREGALAGLSVRPFEPRLAGRMRSKDGELLGSNPIVKISKGVEVVAPCRPDLLELGTPPPCTGRERWGILPYVFLINI